MMEMIKLIWDFRSLDGEKIAEHHVKHLSEYIKNKNLDNTSADFTQISDLHWVAYITTAKINMIQLRDDLKPHRGELV